MKRSIRHIAATSIILSIVLSGVYAFAFKQDDVDRLRSTGECKNCDFSDYNFHGANNSPSLGKVNVSGANFSGANLTFKNMEGSNFSEANFTMATMKEIAANGADFSRANLTEAKLPGARLNGVNFSGATIRNADLKGASLSGSNMLDAVLDSASFDNSDLSGAALEGATIISCSFTGANTENIYPYGITDGKPERGFYVIAHMTNTLLSVDWAMGYKANAIECDLRFTDEGVPEYFKHGGICDCTCYTPNKWLSLSPVALAVAMLTSPFKFDPDNVCSALKKDKGGACSARCDVKDFFQNITVKHLNKLSLIIIDSKIDKFEEVQPGSRVDLLKWLNKARNVLPNRKMLEKGKQHTTEKSRELNILKALIAGTNVVEFLEEHLFNRGYAGRVVISSAEFPGFWYLYGAAERAQKSRYKNRILFAFDQEKDVDQAIRLLKMLPGKNLAYGAGITSCVPKTHEGEIERAIKHRPETIVMTYTWTIDKESSMKGYVERKIDGIITNYPIRLYRYSQLMKLKLARPGIPMDPSKQ